MAVAVSAVILLAVIVLAVTRKRRCADCGARFPVGGLGQYHGSSLCRYENACASRGGSRSSPPSPLPGRKPCQIHRDGHIYGCPVTTWTPPGPPRPRP
jgi:hypothetical protein